MAGKDTEIKVTYKLLNDAFTSGISEINQSMNTLNKEFKVQKEEMKNTATASEKFEASIAKLSKEYDLQTQKTRETEVALQNMKEVFGENSKEVQTWQNKLLDAQASQAKLKNALDDTKRSFSEYQAEQERIASKQKTLDNLFEATGRSVDDYADVLGVKLVNAIKEGKVSSDGLETAIVKVGKSALGSEADLTEMKRVLGTLDDGNSIENVCQELKQLDTTADSTEESLSKIGDGVKSGNLMAAAEQFQAAGEKIKEFAKTTQDAFAEIDEAYDNITGKTGKSADEFKANFESIYSTMKIDNTGDLGNAIGDLNAQLDLSGDKLTNAARVSMQFAEINQTDVSSAIKSAKGAMEAYNIENEKYGSVLDTVTATSQRTGVAVDKLFESVTTGAPQIKALGLNFAEGTELMGQFEKAGLDGNQMLSGLTKATVNYAKEGKTLQQGLQGTVDKIKNASSETEALNEATKVFGSKAAPRMVDAIKRGAFNLDEMTKAAQNNSGVVSDTFNKSVDAIDKQAIAVQNVKLAMAQIGDELAIALAPLADVLIPIIRDIGNGFANLPGPVKQFIVILGGLTVAFSALLPVLMAVNAGLLPFILIGVAIAAVIAAIIVVFQNWGAITDWFSKKWQQLGQWFKDTMNGIKNSAVSGFNQVSNYARQMVNNVKNWFSGLKTSALQIWEGIKQGISDKIKGAWKAVTDTVSKIKNAMNFKWSLPHLKMPHFSISGGFSLNPPRVPKFHISWHALGGIFDKPTIFGNHGVGEAGPEAIIPLTKSVLGRIGEGIIKHLPQHEIAGNQGVIVAISNMELTVGTKTMAKMLINDIEYETEMKVKTENRRKGKR
ncbi:phage tail tape measure protein [Vaginisenegalia massiliensis]|uniref:phage tail tape measure protein n=1 Tax=Vaginisenegalia massiliensis TaxID=2058294 RepID=UPI000F5394FD|nr:phage tail tape measure protein [Vaginisenegalia massiliensis]